MDINDYNHSARQEDSKNDKLANSFLNNRVDSGYDSVYNSCASVLTEKSFNRTESFDIFSPIDSKNNHTPIKQAISTYKYHASTPKNTASIKRHLYSSFISRSLKRSRSENEENEPKTISSNVHKKHQEEQQFNESGRRLKAPLHNYDYTPPKNILSFKCDTNNHRQLSIIKNTPSSTQEYSTQYQKESSPSSAPVPERPSKSLRNFAHLVKHSKRKLDIPAAEDNAGQGRILYYNGSRYCNIIGKLAPYPAILDDIFKKLSGKDLLNVSLVSRNWNTLVTSNRCSNARIKQYLHDSLNIKENLQQPTEPAIVFHQRQPFKQFNLASTSNHTDTNSTIPNCTSSFSENQNIVQQLGENERLVKCPRCGRGSITSDCASGKLLSSSLISLPSKTSNGEFSYINRKADTICRGSSIDHSIDGNQTQISEGFGVCTSVTCKYEFCLKCHCDYHPGEKCKTSEPESPSKLLICYKKVKSNKNKPNTKTNSNKRQSLRRLCFS